MKPDALRARAKEKCGACSAIAPRAGGRVESRALNIIKTTRRGPGMPRVYVYVFVYPVRSLEEGERAREGNNWYNLHLICIICGYVCIILVFLYN